MTWSKLKPISMGIEQVELQSGSELPFVLGLTLPMTEAGSGGVTFTERFAGFDMAAVAKAIRLKHLLLRGATVQLHSLDSDLPLGSVQMSEAAEAAMSGGDRAHLDIAEVASAFGWRIPFPERVTEEDLLLLAVLVAIVRGQPVPIESLNCEITKNSATIELLQQCQNAQLEVVACYPSLAQPSKFLGVAVQSGPIQFHCTDAKIANAASILQQLQNASENERRGCRRGPSGEEANMRVWLLGSTNSDRGATDSSRRRHVLAGPARECMRSSPEQSRCFL